MKTKPYTAGVRLADVWRRLSRDRRGGSATMLAMSMPVMVGATGLGVETGLWHLEKRQLQTVADAAAAAAALERATGGKDTSIALTALAVEAAQKNGFATAAPNGFALNWPPRSGPNAGNIAAIEVLVSQQQPALFSAIFGESAMTVSARSVAMIKTTGQACVLALDRSADNAASSSGSTIENLAGCTMASNSSSASAISIGGSATVTAQSIWTAGGYTMGGSANLTLAQPATTYAWPLVDPYAGLAVPSGITSCTMSNAKFSNVTKTISPGVYCGGIDFGSKANITLSPGTYYINKGDITINAQATVTGNGVTFVLMSTGSANQIGTVTINGGATVNVTAPTDSVDGFTGVTFYQDRSAPTNGVNKLNGGSTMNIGGAVYFPSQQVQFSGNNASGASRCTIIVARLVGFIGNSALNDSGCLAAGVKPVQVSGVQFSD